MSIIGRSSLLAAAAFFFAATPQPGHAQSAELKQLDAQLPGSLINDPTRIDWEIYGNEVSSTPVVDETIPGGGAALRIDVRDPGEYIYVAGANLPLTKKIETGDQVTVGFYARTVSSAAPDGKGVVRIRFQQNAAPYPGYGEETLSIGNDWGWYEVTTRAEFGLRKKDGIVAMQFGRTKQTLEIGQVIIVKGASSIAGNPQKVKKAEPAPQPELKIPASLQNAGTLLNDPAKANWHFEGAAGSWDTIPGQQIFGVAPTRMRVTKSGAQPHELFVTMPLNSEISAGDELLIAIASRTETAASEDGRARFKARIEQSKAPFDAATDNDLTVGPKWQLLRIKTKAGAAIEGGSAQLALHLAGQVQTLDLGPIFVYKVETPAP